MTESYVIKQIIGTAFLIALKALPYPGVLCTVIRTSGVNERSK